MNDVGMEYGIALFEIANDKNIVDEIYNDLCTVDDMFCENTDYPKLLSSPAISLSERFSCIDEAFSYLNPSTISLLKTLCKNNDIKQFSDLKYHFDNLYNGLTNLKKATVTTSVSLNEEEKEKIKNVLIKKYNSNIIIDYKIDENIMGGIIINVDDDTYDGSIKRKLSDIKKVIS